MGMHRIWGSLKSTKTSAVGATLIKLVTDVDQLFKRKTATSHERWWFLLKGEETAEGFLEWSGHAL